MMARWKDLCLNVDDQMLLGRFWAAVVGLEVETSPGAVSLKGARPEQRIWVNHVDEPKTVKNRVHLDICAAAVADLEALGATVLTPDEETGFGWTVMADPEGHEFCCFLRSPAEVPSYTLHGIGIDCVDARAQAAWWGEVFGVEPITYAGHDWVTLEGATVEEWPTLDFAPVPEPKRGRNRVHWDVLGDVEPLLAFGATHLWDTPDWTVLADPEGNEFCVFAPA